MTKVKVTNGALDEFNGNIILRGVIESTSYESILAGGYQREARSLQKLKGMIVALKEGKQMPDIEIGIRGSHYVEREGTFSINHECYVVDGLQRLTACMRVMAESPTTQIRLGAMFHFGTDEAWEKARFMAVNGGDGGRIAVSPNILLRNSADSSPSVAALMRMSASDKEFVLREKVSWGQNKGRGEILTALTVLKTSGQLHSHFGPGRSSRYDELMRACDKTMEIVGPNNWRANVRQFFWLIDQAFGVSSIKYADLSAHIKFGFMRTLAQMLADHRNFWTETKLTVERRDTDKLRQFPINDPGIVGLIAAGGGVNPILYQRLVNHMNSGRKIHRLTKWSGQAADGIMPLEDDSAGTNNDDDAGTSEPGSEI